MKKTGRSFPVPPMAKIAIQSAVEKHDMQLTIVNTEFNTASSQISDQILKDLGLDSTKFDYIVDHNTMLVAEHPLGTIPKGVTQSAPAPVKSQLVKEPVNPAARKK